MLPKAVNVGPLTLHTYGAIIALAVLAGWWVAKRRAQFYKIPEHIFEEWILLIPLTLSLVGARLYHVLDYWEVYKINPGQIIQVQNGGIGIWGAVLGLLAGVFIISSFKKINYLSALDAIAPALALGQAIGRIGNWVNQEAFGPPTNLPWGITIDEANRPQEFILISKYHPTFFYESILNLLLFILLTKITTKSSKPGQIFGVYLLGYSLSRFFLEFLRIDTWTMGTIKIAQVISVLGILIGTWLFLKVKKR